MLTSVAGLGTKDSLDHFRTHSCKVRRERVGAWLYVSGGRRGGDMCLCERVEGGWKPGREGAGGMLVPCALAGGTCDNTSSSFACAQTSP